MSVLELTTTDAPDVQLCTPLLSRVLIVHVCGGFVDRLSAAEKFRAAETT